MKKIKDGIVDINRYYSSPIKIMWILKEGNVSPDDYDKDRDLCAELSSDWHKPNALAIPTFRKMIYATYGILYPDVEWADVPYANAEAYDVIKQIAYININKYPGGSFSENKSIKSAYDQNKYELLNQISDCSPNVLIFGNTLQYFDALDLKSIGYDISSVPKKHVDPSKAGKTTTYYSISKVRLCIHAFHPSYVAINDKIYWHEIKTAYQNWLLES